MHTAGHNFEEYVNPYLGKTLRQVKMDKVFRRGAGCELFDDKNQPYLDFIASYGALPFGFNHPEIWEAIRAVEANAEPSFVQPSYLDAAGELAKLLVTHAPPGIRYVTFANSGAEAVEAALKMARIRTGRQGIVTTENSFHGKTLGALSATGKDSYQKGFGAPVPGFIRIAYGDPAALEALLAAQPDDYAAFIVEPIQGEGGIVIPPDGYLKKVLDICHRYGVLLIADEVQTGLGRTGRLFACQHEGITPDIITLAKALGGGLLPIGACLATEEVYTEEFGTKHSSTFAGNTLACRVGIKALELLTRDGGRLLEAVEKNGKLLLEGLRQIKARYAPVIREVRGRGLMLGLELGASSATLPNRLLGILGDQEYLSPLVSSYLLNVEHLRVAPTLNGASVIRLEPPLIVSGEQCRRALDALERTAARLSSGDTAGIVAHLAGVAAAPVAARPLAPRELVKPSEDPGESRFAFLVHPLDLKNYREFDPSFAFFSEAELTKLLENWNDLMEPFVVGRTRIVSRTGQTAYGEFICVSRTSAELTHLPKDQVLAELSAAVNLAKERGAKIVGLGAYTSVVSKGGRDLRNLGVALTTGNSYTVAAAVEAMLEAARILDVPVGTTTAAVVGATGSIGRATAHLLAEEVNALYLIGNPLNQEHSRRRLMKVSAEIYRYLNRKGFSGGGAVAAFTRNHPLIPAPEADLEYYLQFAETVMDESPLVYTIELEKYLPMADVVITATSQVNSLIMPEMLKYGAIVCDVARPPDVSVEVKTARPDVLVIDGGVVAVPGEPKWGWNFGFEDGLAYACMSETMMLALEKEYHHYSLGIDISMETIQFTRELAEKHGFKLAGFRSFDRPLDRETWEKVLAARSLRRARVDESTLDPIFQREAVGS